MKIGLPLFMFVLVVSGGCYNPPDFGSTPKIEYASIDKVTETDPATSVKSERVTVTVTFEDGDGDLGASAAELSDDNFTTAYEGIGNYELITIQKQPDGSVKEFVYQGDKPKWMPLLKSDNTKKGPLKGKLDLNFTRYYANSSVLLEEKYKIRIRDRKLQYSNQVETDFITVPGYR